MKDQKALAYANMYGVLGALSRDGEAGAAQSADGTV